MKLSNVVGRIVLWYGYKAPAALRDKRAIDPRYKRWPMVTTRS